MNVKEFRDICETLGRFADIRETAKEPRDRIVIQVGSGRLKFIAGTEDSTVIVDAGPAEGKAKAIVKSRLLLSGAKALRGKAEIQVDVDRGQAEFHVEGGGTMTLKSFTSLTPDFVRPKVASGNRMPHRGLTDAAKIFGAVTSKEEPANKVYFCDNNGPLKFIASDDRSMAVWEPVSDVVRTMHDAEPIPNLHGAVPVSVLSAMRDLTGSGHISWDRRIVLFTADNYTVVTNYLPEEPDWSEPPITRTAGLTVETKVLVDALKGVKGKDEHARARLSVDVALNKMDLLVEDWERRDGRFSVPAAAIEITNDYSGSIGVDAGRLNSLLSAMPTKFVDVSFNTKRPSAVEVLPHGSIEWRAFISPVV